MIFPSVCVVLFDKRGTGVVGNAGATEFCNSALGAKMTLLNVICKSQPEVAFPYFPWVHPDSLKLHPYFSHLHLSPLPLRILGETIQATERGDEETCFTRNDTSFPLKQRLFLMMAAADHSWIRCQLCKTALRKKVYIC